MQYNGRMLRLRPLSLLDFAGIFTVGAVAILSYLSIEAPAGRWAAVGLTLAFAALLFFHPHHEPQADGFSLSSQAYFAAQTALTIALILLQPRSLYSAPILFFVLSAEAMVALPMRQAAAWIGVFLLVTLAHALSSAGWPTGLLFTLPYAGGYSFFGTFGKALRDADLARQRSERLLDELRAAQDQLKELAVAEERNRLAREMHDSLGHRLTVAVVQLEGAQRLIPTDPERAARMISAMREQMKEALADLRGTVATLSTPLADDLPLLSALARLAQNFQESTGLAVRLSLPASLPALTEVQRLALYRAAQETLTNAQRHARARQVWLEVSVADDRVRLTTADDGVGLPLELNGGGFGLRGLRERAAQLGGDLQLGARPGGGAEVRLSLPRSGRAA